MKPQSGFMIHGQYLVKARSVKPNKPVFPLEKGPQHQDKYQQKQTHPSFQKEKLNISWFFAQCFHPIRVLSALPPGDLESSRLDKNQGDLPVSPMWVLQEFDKPPQMDIFLKEVSFCKEAFSKIHVRF